MLSEKFTFENSIRELLYSCVLNSPIDLLNIYF